jgi:hypothetical protein
LKHVLITLYEEGQGLDLHKDNNADAGTVSDGTSGTKTATNILQVTGDCKYCLKQ